MGTAEQAGCRAGGRRAIVGKGNYFIIIERLMEIYKMYTIGQTWSGPIKVGSPLVFTLFKPFPLGHTSPQGHTAIPAICRITPIIFPPHPRPHPLYVRPITPKTIYSLSPSCAVPEQEVEGVGREYSGWSISS